MKTILTTSLIAVIATICLSSCKKEIFYHQTITLKGSVTDSYSGKPIANASISLTQYNDFAFLRWGSNYITTFYTDSGGKFFYILESDIAAAYQIECSKKLTLNR